ncbi:polyribonucleotide nucleotidyltransferase, partial [Butyricicoccus sp. 1XD8-22]
AGNKDAINMVEAGALEVPEEIMLEAIMFGHEEIKKLIAFQEQIVAEVGKEKIAVTLFEVDKEIEAQIKAACEEDMNAAIQTVEKHAREDAISAVKER